MSFQWDPAKDETNQAKHGIPFERALRVFRGPVLIDPDQRRDYGEPRSIAVGVVDDAVLSVVFTKRDNDVRIISARKANRNERQRYRETQARPVREP